MKRTRNSEECPYCDGTLDFGDTDVHMDIVYQEWTCTKCKRTGNDAYFFDHALDEDGENITETDPETQPDYPPRPYTRRPE